MALRSGERKIELPGDAFLEGRIRFGQIAHVIGTVLSAPRTGDTGSLEGILEADADARRLARVAACS